MIKKLQYISLMFITILIINIPSAANSAPSDYNVSTTASVVTPGVKEKYTIKYYLKTNPTTAVSGFECNCLYNGMSGKWAGSNTDACRSGVSKPIALSGLPLPDGACCLAKPVVNGTKLPQPAAPTYCWY